MLFWSNLFWCWCYLSMQKKLKEWMIRDVELILSVSKTGLSVPMEKAKIDFGNGSIPLPSVNNWIVMMQRFDGSLDFNRNWIEYRNGFGDTDEGEFWLGNEKVYRLTNRTGLIYRLRIEVFVDHQNFPPIWFYIIFFELWCRGFLCAI